jgi:hypothetical protein
MAMIHINRGATSLGTFSEEEVREGLRTGRFAPTDLGWREGMANWQPLSQFSEFAADFGPAPAAPSPQAAPTSTTPAATAGPPSQTPAPRSGLPWDRRQERGIFNAFIETLQMVLSRPADAFTAMKREGGLGEPLLYAIIGGSFGLIFYFIYQLAFQSLGIFANRPNPLAHLVGAGIGGVILIIFVPVMVAIGAFINAALLHVCLMIVGGAKQPFETTFRVICFASGSVFPLMVVPLCGGVVAVVWDIVLRCIGLARAHDTDTGRAVLAVLLPVIVCCCGGFLCVMMLGGFGALMHANR